ncbi:MAG: dienelactone hydrolase family protein [Chloroherpetonaceae bacterium]|nr:dienelactone hydrolase family protein [Chloroherpetonaceae bacterium]
MIHRLSYRLNVLGSLLLLVMLFCGSLFSQSKSSKVESKGVTYNSGNEKVSGYFSKPKSKGTFPGVIMIHEWWGLNDWVKAMADSLAAEGYAVLAVDLYRGKVGKTREEATELMQGTPKDRVSADLSAAYAFLNTLPETKGRKIGSVGWCMGGGYSLTAANLLGEKLSACIICYGRVTTESGFLKPVAAPVLGIFGGKDRGIPVDSVKAFAAALNASGRSAELAVYDSSGHAFMNPNNERGYNATDANDAWSKTLTFFATRLKK